MKSTANRHLRIQMAARAVVAVGVPFAPRGETYADADIARDEIRALPPPPEPLVLRVWARGGTAWERALVEGDWLCDRDGSEPSRLPRPSWSIDPEASAWSKKRAWLEAWETCPDGVWMLAGVGPLGLDRKLLTRAACACAATVRDLVPPTDPRVLPALEGAMAWVRGEISIARVRELTEIAVDAVEEIVEVEGLNAMTRAYEASLAVAYAARAAYADDYAGYASYSVACVVNARGSGVPRERRQVMRELVPLIRAEIQTLEVLRAAAAILR